jgi:demethylmenaquinone methyltransferase / 2-methoxy-6-polyprenyl-1,4-benzoquinol methylase
VRLALDKGKLNTVYDRLARRYDFQHSFLTANSDEGGRRLVVEKAVRWGNIVLDSGAGTGSTALLAAKKTGPTGKITLLDMNERTLTVAKEKVATSDGPDQFAFKTGDMTDLPFADNSFDAALSTYSMCPLYDPAKGALELYRVVKPGGRIGIAHSIEPNNPLVKWLADRVEDVVWHIPSISMGCRVVSVLPTLESAGGRVIFKQYIGVPFWPFVVLAVEKPAAP